jgi:uncharacterized protein
VAPDYCIDIVKLKPGTYRFEFAIGADFLAGFPERLLERADAALVVDLTKDSRQIDLRLALQGVVELPCDRCLRPYDQAVVGDMRIVYSFDPSFKAADNTDIFYIGREQQYLDLRQDFYDFLSLQLPIRRIPPDCPGAQCPPEVMELLGLDDSQDSDTEPLQTDPRWAGLSNLSLN